jgi:hypothetical protein
MIVLAILLGLVGGIAVAAVIETVRPTVVGSAAVAQEFDAPLLGTLRSTPEDEVALADLGSLPTRFALAVRPAVVPSVGLVGASPSVDLRPLAARLDSQEQSPSLRAGTRFVMAQHGEPPATTTAVAAEPKEHGSAAVRVFAAAPGSAPGLNGHGIGGVVVVAPSLLRTAEIEETHHLLRIMPAPLLGIVTYPRAERRRNRRARFGR